MGAHSSLSFSKMLTWLFVGHELSLIGGDGGLPALSYILLFSLDDVWLPKKV